MGDILKINTDAVVNTADVITNFSKYLETSRNDADRAVSNLDNAWESPGASKMIGIYNKLKKEGCPNVQKVLGGYVTMLNQQISDGYIAAEENNKTLADQFK